MQCSAMHCLPRPLTRPDNCNATQCNNLLQCNASHGHWPGYNAIHFLNIRSTELNFVGVNKVHFKLTPCKLAESFSAKKWEEKHHWLSLAEMGGQFRRAELIIEAIRAIGRHQSVGVGGSSLNSTHVAHCVIAYHHVLHIAHRRLNITHWKNCTQRNCTPHIAHYI